MRIAAPVCGLVRNDSRGGTGDGGTGDRKGRPYVPPQGERGG